MKSLTRRRYIGLLFISPWIIGFLVLQLYPFITSLIYSFAEYNIMSSPKFIGIQNYVQLLTRDREFWNSLRVTVIYTLFTVPGKLVVALLVAVLMNKNMRGVNAIRTIYYLPSLFGGSIAVSILWKLMFQNTGIINQIIGLVGVQPVKWLGNPNTAMPVIIMLNLWQFGSAFVMFLAALKNVPGELYEAAEIDGANRWKQIWHVTLPGLRGTIITLVLLAIGRVFYSDFGLFYQVPMRSGLISSVTDTIDVFVYKALTQLNDVGRASAAGFLQSVLGFVLVLTANMVVRKIDKDNALF